jgi:hypothetical protein
MTAFWDRTRRQDTVSHDGLRECGELHSLLAKRVDLPHDLFDRSLAAIEDRTQLDRGGFNGSLCNLLCRLARELSIRCEGDSCVSKLV